jgi:hypothetical protein
MINLHKSLEELTSNIKEKGELIQRDMIEPLELYYKHYNSTNTELIKQGTQIWNNLHQERTAMLFAKENYYNQMHTMGQY